MIAHKDNLCIDLLVCPGMRVMYLDTHLLSPKDLNAVETNVKAIIIERFKCSAVFIVRVLYLQS